MGALFLCKLKAERFLFVSDLSAQALKEKEYEEVVRKCAGNPMEVMVKTSLSGAKKSSRKIKVRNDKEKKERENEFNSPEWHLKVAQTHLWSGRQKNVRAHHRTSTIRRAGNNSAFDGLKWSAVLPFYVSKSRSIVWCVDVAAMMFLFGMPMHMAPRT
jgi:hypothetical protein